MKRLWMISLLFVALSASAQITLVKKGKAKARIVLAEDNETNRQAAQLLNRFVGEMIAREAPEAPLSAPQSAPPSAPEGATNVSVLKSNVAPSGAERGASGASWASGASGASVIIGEPTDRATEDGFEILCQDQMLHIKTGGGKGAVYGVVTLLEQYLGVSYWAYEAYDCPRGLSTIELPRINHAESPAFRYRQTHSYGNSDPVYRLWYRLEEPKDVFAADLWVHTFNRILPSRVYGEAHPEWYSFINGKRQPGDHSQWCLTNDEVFEMACQKIDSIFRANPGRKTISVSQNDGNNTQCRCPECAAVDEYEGSPSGNLIRFLNKLARRFPDKEFSTLAYLYSMHPPKHTRPLPNVNIMLCDIDCKREVPLTDNASGQDFVRALTGWSAISDNIFVWDYGINFDNMVSPFPNFHILQKNLQLFKENHATMVFEQVNGQLGTDFSELRAYMLAKLMWNPYCDADSLMRTFLDGYYGPAGRYLYQYQKIMQGALLASGTPLWIYDSPISHKDGMLNKNLRKTYNELFDKAEGVLSGCEVRGTRCENSNELQNTGDASNLVPRTSYLAPRNKYLDRVRIARLPLQYSELEIARTDPNSDVEQTKTLLSLFEERTAQYGIPTLNERQNRPADYCRLYRERFLPTGIVNKAAGAIVQWINPPQQRYRPIADKALTDGLYGGTTYVESWVGWCGEDADFILDMGREQSVSSIRADFLHQLGAWILLPPGGSYEVSADGKTWQPFGAFRFEEDRDLAVKFRWGGAEVASPVRARYIKVHVETLGNCPSWHYGVGYPAWFFLDEIVVQ